MKRILSLTLCLALVGLMAASVMARPADNGERPRFKVMEAAEPAPFNSMRVDTFWLFAASGAGAYGQPGTDARGYTFDDFGLRTGPALAGWTPVDETTQLGDYWHIANAQMNVGHGTEPIITVPQNDGLTNNWALWCGREDACGWIHPDGYGTSWDQYWVAELDGTSATTVAYDFWYIGDFEGETFDFFEFLTEDANGELEVILDNRVGGEQLLQHYTGTWPTGRDRLIWRFTSDTGWSDEDGSYLSDIGAVWIDKIVINSGLNDYNTDFETGTVPAGMYADSPAGAGWFGDLYFGLQTEDLCTLNNTFAWAFFDPEGQANPPYENPPVIFGPPYMKNAIESDMLELKHVAGNASGVPFVLGAEDAVYIDFWAYRDCPLDNLVFYNWYVAAQGQDAPCLGGWQNDNFVYYGDDKIWLPSSWNVTVPIADSAAGLPVVGIKAKVGAVDMCDVWCNINGSGENHTPAPFLDNVRVKLIQASSIGWVINTVREFQDNFPEAGNNKVRIDSAENVEPPESQTVIIGDSCLVELNASLAGGIKVNTSNPSGENRPELYMYFRVIEGPHAGSTSPTMGDPSAADGIWSPYIGTEVIFGETWNYMICDSASYQGQIHNNKWVFDFNDEYFVGGDIIEYFYQVETTGGVIETRPIYAKSDPNDYPLLPSYYNVRCLPTAGTELLYCDDGRAPAPYMEQALRYNGYQDYDIYYTSAPTSGLENGLAGRATLADIDQYRTIIWDSGNLASGTFTNGNVDASDKTDDTVLITDWITNSGHDAYLWALGNLIAKDLGNSEPFLSEVLGVYLLSPSLYYADAGGVLVPEVEFVLACMDPGSIWLDGGCPFTEDFELIRLSDDVLKTVQAYWGVPAVGFPTAIAGAYNLDPDGNGNAETPFRTRAKCDAWSYHYALDSFGSGGAGVDYSKLIVGSVLEDCFNQLPDAEPDGVPEIPAFTSLDGNFPNPFNPKTTIRFALSADEHVNLSIYDISGRLVKELVNGPMLAGSHEVVWSGKTAEGAKAASGVYFYKMNAGDYSATEKMVMLK